MISGGYLHIDSFSISVNMKLNFGVRLPVSGPLASPSSIIRIGEEADKLGFDAITTHDHVLLDYEDRYHNAGGTAELVDDFDKRGLPVTNVYETMATLSVLAGRTKHVRLIPCAAVLPWRHPILFAKQAITLHELSGGRFVFNVCIGNLESDFLAMNVRFRAKGKMMNEYLQIVQLMLSSEREISFSGKYVSIPPLTFNPKPSKKIPLWISGHFNDIAFGRVVTYGDGFLAGTSYPAAFREGLPRLRDLLKQKGRNPDDLEIGVQTFICMMKDSQEAGKRSRRSIEGFFHGPEFDRPDPKNPTRTLREAKMEGTLKSALVGSPGQVIKQIEAYAAEGVRFFDMRQVNKSTDDIIDMMRLFSTEVMPSFS
jgi:alkanesulfonate monooxygenase SsuD/methylene tetrahydromethanopterin reductase-like flavin-dependent oxidoreductase (luciferase family)